MKRFFAALLFAAAVPMFAQPADLMIEMAAQVEGQQPATRVAVGQTVMFNVQWSFTGTLESSEGLRIEIEVPGLVTNPDLGSLSCTNTQPVRCTITRTAEPYGFLSVLVRIDSPGTQTATARIVHPEGKADPNPANDVATYTFEAVALPSLEILTGVFASRVEPGSTFTFSATAQNRGVTPATNVILTITLPAGGTFIAGGSSIDGPCEITNPTTLTCRRSTLEMNQSLNIEAAVRAPERTTGEDIVIDIAVTSDQDDLNPSDNHATREVTMLRQFFVTNTQDEGSGSLRQAILDVNALCERLQPCAILFRIPAPVPQYGWFTIQPRTPYPEIVATVNLDGATQTQFTGDTNPEGPEIEINGGLMAEGSGLRLRPNCDVQVRNLAVNGFPGYGVEVNRLFQGYATDPCFVGTSNRLTVDINRNYLGTDPRGRIAQPNQRGLGLFTSFARVYDNVISGNHRAGIYIGSGQLLAITTNRIGVGSDLSPLGNGAGIFIDMREQFAALGGADIEDNVIAHNHGMAVARTRLGEILVTRNKIYGNLQQGIDVDVDGVSPRRAADEDVPNAPVLFSASYDPARNATIVRGRIDSDHPASARSIEVYASSGLSQWGTAQAELSVQKVSIDTGHQDFEIVVPADLRGKFITATYSAVHYTGFARPNPGRIATQTHFVSQPADTSELSNPVGVQ